MCDIIDTSGPAGARLCILEFLALADTTHSSGVCLIEAAFRFSWWMHILKGLFDFETLVHKLNMNLHFGRHVFNLPPSWNRAVRTNKKA